ncbi:MAG: hypothetical protein RL732_244 [Bacteroidota bacterium]
MSTTLLKTVEREAQPPQSKRGKGERTPSAFRKALVSLNIAEGLLKRSYRRYGTWKGAYNGLMRLHKRREEYKTDYPKIRTVNGRYYQNMHIPGWPSAAFDRYIDHLLNVGDGYPQPTLFALVFDITNKCGFQCRHCVEWENLNRKDALSRYELLSIIEQFHRLGVSQVQLSGGEPLNRFEDLIYLLDNAPKGIDYWIYSNGYTLNQSKAKELREHGLTGVLISLDHFQAGEHDAFRGVPGSYERVMEAARNVTENGMVLGFSCCATKEFISRENLLAYAELARSAGATFIQFLEPEAVGRFAGRPVKLNRKEQQVLEEFYLDLNYKPEYADFPIIGYPSWIKRFTECPGKGNHFVYVNADGQVQACPFCQNASFHALDENLGQRITAMRTGACSRLEFYGDDVKPSMNATWLKRLPEERERDHPVLPEHK